MKIGEGNIESLFMSMMLKIHIYLKYINPKKKPEIHKPTLLWNGLKKIQFKNIQVMTTTYRISKLSYLNQVQFVYNIT